MHIVIDDSVFGVGEILAVRRVGVDGVDVCKLSLPTGLLRDGSELELTPREQEVIGLVREGLSDKDIGVHLYIATDTAKRHVHSIIVKLKVHNRTEAAVKTCCEKVVCGYARSL
jgi:DNA-binding CsgD family transcriptional regulator